MSTTNLRRLRYAVTLIVLVMALFVSTEYALLNVNAVPSLTVTPNSGPIGQAVTVTGSGFSLSDVGACTSMLSTPVNIVSASTCNFANNGVLIGSSFTVVAGAALGVYFVTVTGSTGDFATASFTVTPPTITLTPNSGPIGQGVTITGSGFAPGDVGACTSVLSTPTNIVSAPTCNINVSGQLVPPASFTVAALSAPGVYIVTVTGITGDFASAAFTVTPPTITLTPNSGPSGTPVTITGSGFNTVAGACTSVLSSPTNIVSAPTCNVDATGKLVPPATFTVAAGSAPGAYVVTVKGPSGDTASATFVVTTTSPSIVLTPNSGPIGKSVTITGSGFSTGDAGVCTSVLSSPSNIVFAATCNINSSGQLIPPATFSVATLSAPGLYVVTVKGSTGDFASAAFTVTGPSIALSPKFGPVLTGVGITGSGFDTGDAGACASVLSSPTNIVSASTCVINSSGVIAAGGIFTVVLSATPGIYTVTVTGSTGDFASAIFVVTTPAASLVLAPNSGPAGTPVSMTGNGFNTADVGACSSVLSTPVNIVVAPTCTFTASGQLTGSSFTVANGATPGTYVVKVLGSSGDFAEANFIVTTTIPSLILTPTSGPSGTAVSMTGTGFNTGDAGACTSVLSTPVNIVTGATCTVAVTGQLTGSSFTVASPVTPGAYVVAVTGITGDIATAVFVVTGPAIVLTPNSGPSGTAVTITGGGFNTGDVGACTSVLSSPSNIVSAPTCNINAAGKLLPPATFTVANSATPGVYSVTVQGSTGDFASATFTVTTTSPTIVLTPSGGPAGTAVSVTGSGFSPGDVGFCASLSSTPVNIVTAGTCPITASGQLTGSSFTVSNTATAGTYVVTVKGSTGDLASANFIVMSPHIALTPASGPIGTVVIVTGGGFSAGDAGACTYLQSPAAPVLLAGGPCTITSTGQLTGSTFTVAPTAAVGPYIVTVKGSTGDVAAAAFNVNPFSPKITLTPSVASDGATVTIAGTGFNPADTNCAGPPAPTSTPLTVWTAAPTCTVTGGNLVGSFVVSATALPGTYTITLTGDAASPSHDSAQANFVVSGVPVSTVSLVPGIGARGTVVGVTGTFTGSPSTCSITGTPVSSPVCTMSGTGFTGHFIVSSTVQAGPYTITVQGGSQQVYGVFIVQGPFIQLSDPAAIGQVISGPTGTHVSIEGSFFPLSDTTCQISSPSGGNFISQPGASCSVFAGSGIFSGFNNVTGSFVVGNVQEGQYVVQVTTSGSGSFAQAVFNVTSGAFIQLGVNNKFAGVGQVASGPTGTHVSIEGSQFLPADVLNGATCSVSSTSNGAIIVNSACSFFKAPNGFVNVTGSFLVGNVQPGQYVIRVTGSAGDTAQAVFSVTLGASLSLNPASGRVGTHVVVNGTNFLPSDSICTISSTTNGAVVLNGACAITQGTGAPQASFLVGNVQPGQYVIQVTGNQGDFGQALFNVTLGASLSLNPASGRVGTHVIANGTGFLPSDTSCTLSSTTNGAIILNGGCAINQGTGAPQASFLVGNVQPGQYVIQITGNQGDFAQALFNVTIGPRITLSPSSGRIGTHVAVTGSGFLPTDTSCTISSTTNGAIVLNGACALNSGSGSPTASFLTGNVQPGQYVIQVTGNQGDFAQAIFNVTLGPKLTLSPASGRIGTHILVNGTGFIPTDSACTISSPSGVILGGTAACSIQVGTGAPGGSFTVANVLPGQYLIQVSATPGGDFAQAVLNVTIGAKISLSPATGPVGAHVLVNGTGFLPTDNTCTISSPGSAIVIAAGCSIQTGTGVVGGSFTAGNVVPGQYVIQVTGSGGDFAQAVFNVTMGATITLTPGKGAPGSNVNFTGSGFLPTDTSCVVSSPGSGAVMGGTQACAIRAGKGTVNGSFLIGNILPGQYLIQVTGNQGDFAQAVLIVVNGPRLTLSPGTGRIGDSINVNGTGFLPTDTSCTLLSGSSNTFNPIQAGSGGVVIAVGTGIVNGSFIIGNVPPGQYVMQVNCNGGDSAQAVLNVIGGLPSIQLFPTNAATGATVTVIAYGLSVSDTGCYLMAYNNAVFPGTPANTLMASSTCSITAPQTAQGSFVVGPYATTNIPYNITVRGTPVNDIPAWAPFNVTASIFVTPPTGSRGTVFTYTGSGFSSIATSCTVTVIPSIGTPTCFMSGGIGQVAGSITAPPGAPSGTYGLIVTDNTGKTATGFFTVGTPSALLVLNPASVQQSQPVGVAGTGFNPDDTSCTITAGGTPPWAGPGGTAPVCSIAGGYASGSFTVSNTASGGYYLITITGAAAGDFAQNFLAVELQSTVTTYSTTSTTSTTSTSLTTTTTSIATSYSYSSTTIQTTGIYYTTFTHATLTTVSAPTTTSLSVSTTTTQTHTTVVITQTTSFTTVSCGPLPCGFAIRSEGINLGPVADNVGLLAVLLLMIPMLLRRLLS